MATKRRQLGLPLTRDARLASLAAIDPRELGIGVRQWAVCHELLETIEYRTGSDGCYCYLETLAGVMKVTKRTVQRAVKLLKEKKLLAVEERVGRRGNESNAWRPDWSHLASLSGIETSDYDVAAGEDTATVTPVPQLSPPPDALSPPHDAASPPYKEYQTTSTSTVGRLSTKEVDEEKTPRRLPPPDRRRALTVVRRINRRFNGKRPSPKNLELGWKLAALEAELGERWLANVFEAIRTIDPVNPWSYAWTVARDGSRECPGPGEKAFKLLLARVEPPPDDWPNPAELAMGRREPDDVTLTEV